MNPIDGGPLDYLGGAAANVKRSPAEVEVQQIFDDPDTWASSRLPATHPAIVLQDNDRRSELASLYRPDEGGEG